MRTASLLAVLFLSTLVLSPAVAQDIPLVYDAEHTGMDCATPPFPAFSDLPVIRPLPDPFAWSDGSERSTSFDDWRCRRAEIAAEIQHYEIGEKPAAPDDLVASFADDTLTVQVTVNGETLTLTSAIVLPEGDGPFPAVIGVGRPSGSLPPDIFSSRNVAQIGFNFTQVTSHTQTRGEEPLNELYPELTHIGSYSAWPWGVSRLIDGLEQVADDLPIDLDHLAITGCSFAGKMALYAGAFDERIALTIAQESGGGGAAAWRVSETLGNVETLGNTSFAWFLEDLRQFSLAVPKLPFDHHELMAMVAPRALLVLGNTDYEWLADESGYVSARAAQRVWQTFGIDDRFGFTIGGGHGHCQLPDFERPQVEAFVDKFLLGDMSADTDVQVHPFESVNHERWSAWWGTDDPTYPDFTLDPEGTESLFFEAECAAHGTDWEVMADAGASNDGYVTTKSGLTVTNEAPTGAESTLTIPFTVSQDTTYYIYARVKSVEPGDDSIWLKLDGEEFRAAYGVRGVGEWRWVKATRAPLTAGNHTLTLTYREEDGHLLDKISITSFAYGPEELGYQKALNACTP